MPIWRESRALAPESPEARFQDQEKPNLRRPILLLRGFGEYRVHGRQANSRLQGCAGLCREGRELPQVDVLFVLNVLRRRESPRLGVVGQFVDSLRESAPRSQNDQSPAGFWSKAFTHGVQKNVGDVGVDRSPDLLITDR